MSRNRFGTVLDTASYVVLKLIFILSEEVSKMRLVRVKAIDRILRLGGRMKRAQDLDKLLDKVRRAEIMLAQPVECRVERCHCNRRRG